MRAWWTTACYELLKYSRMRSVLIILIGLPLLLILLLGSAFDTEIKPAKVALSIADQGEMRTSIDAFWAEDAIKPYIKVIMADSEGEVQDFVREGIADYGVHIPSDFSKQLKTGVTTKWLTYSGRYEEKNTAADAVVNRYMTNVNLQLAAMETLGPDYTAGSKEAVKSAATGESLLSIGTLGTGDSQEFGPTTAIQYYSAAYLIMFLLYSGMSAALALLDQKESGTLQRLYTLPASFRSVVFGIFAGTMMLAALQAIIIVGFTSYVYGVAWGGCFGWITLICLFTAAAGVGLAIVIASYVRTRKTTQTLFSIIVFSMTFLSGGMMTGIENMIGGANKWTINHWANVSLRSIMSDTESANIWNEVGILGLIALILSIIAVIRLPKVVKQHA